MLLLLWVVGGGWIFVRVFVGLLFCFDYEIFVLLFLLDFGGPDIPVPIWEGEVEKIVVVVEVRSAVELDHACGSDKRTGNEESFRR